MDARTLRERRKQRIAARTALASKKVRAQDEEMPQWLEDKIEESQSDEVEEVEETEEAQWEQAQTDELELEEDEPAAAQEGDEDVVEDLEGLEGQTDDDESTALGAFNYNPVYQKPTHMGPDKPSGGYHYFGPPPDAGTSYGYYAEANGLQLIAPLAKAVYSPLTGQKMAFQGKVDIDGIAAVLAAVDQMVPMKLASGAMRMTSAPINKIAMSQLYDPVTGEEISDDLAPTMSDSDEEMPEDLPVEESNSDEEEHEGEESMPTPEMTDEEALQAADELLSQLEEEAPVDEADEQMSQMDEEEALQQADELIKQAEEDTLSLDPQEGQTDEEETEEPAAGQNDMEEGDEAAGQDDADMPADLGEPGEEPPPVWEEEKDVGAEEEEEDKAEGQEEEEEEKEEEETEAVQYEALQQIDEKEPLTEADVHMTLFDEQDDHGRATANPYWNVDIKGMPVARIYLCDQPKPAEIRDMFCSADYQRGIAGAVEKVGLVPVLKQVKAHFWANRVYKTKLAKQIRAQVESTANRRVVSTTRNLMKSLLERIAIVCAGMDKNFYREAGNPLKEALWAELHSFGITNPTSIIEAGFRRGSTKYFETVLSKAVEYMEMEPKALAQVKKAIGEMDVLTPGDASRTDELPDATPSEMPTLSQRLATSTVAVGHIPAIMGDALGEHKRALREQLRLGGAGPRVKR